MSAKSLALIGLMLAGGTLQAQAGPATASLELVTESGLVRMISVDSLQHMEQVELKGRIHDGPDVVYRGPRLISVLALADVPQGHDLRGPALRLVVLAQAADSYAVAYSLAELSPHLGNRQAIVALEADGKPLDPKDGPMRIILEGEGRPARWIRELVRLRIIRVAN